MSSAFETIPLVTTTAYGLKEFARSAVGDELSQIVTVEIDVPADIALDTAKVGGYATSEDRTTRVDPDQLQRLQYGQTDTHDHPYRAWLHDRLINQLYTERAPETPCDRVISPRVYKATVREIVRTAVGRAVEELPEVDAYRGFFLRVFDAHTPNDDPGQLLLPLSFASKKKDTQAVLFSVA